MIFEKRKETQEHKNPERLGSPKYECGEDVKFYFSDGIREFECYGIIEVVDVFGTYDQITEASYDIIGPSYLNPEELALYKHIVESQIRKKDRTEESIRVSEQKGR